MSEKTLPLMGVKVVDISMYLAAPVAGRLLAEWGADVIKVEPTSGDLWRYQLSALPASDDFNPFYQIGNRGKKHLALNLKNPKGREALFHVLEDADVFITNFRTPALERLGLQYEELSKKFPKLVYAQVTGYGEKGPDCDAPGYDIVAYWARSGLLGDLPQKDTAPLSSPGGMGDVPTATFLAAGILAALVKQRMTGEGGKVSTSLFASALWTSCVMVTSTQEKFSGIEEWPKDRKNVYIPTVNNYRTSDNEWMNIALLDIINKWDDFARAICKEEWVGDEKFTDFGYLYTPGNMPAIVTDIDEVLATKTAKEWDERLTQYDIPHCRLRHLREQSIDPQAWENNYLFNQKFRGGDSCILVSNPIQFAEIDQIDFPPAGLIGEDTREILKKANYSDEEIDLLIAENITAENK